MRSIIAITQVALDGVMQAPGAPRKILWINEGAEGFYFRLVMLSFAITRWVDSTTAFDSESTETRLRPSLSVLESRHCSVAPFDIQTTPGYWWMRKLEVRCGNERHQALLAPASGDMW
jgi:hypothetical protein